MYSLINFHKINLFLLFGLIDLYIPQILTEAKHGLIIHCKNGKKIVPIYTEPLSLNRGSLTMNVQFLKPT